MICLVKHVFQTWSKHCIIQQSCIEHQKDFDVLSERTYDFLWESIRCWLLCCATVRSLALTQCHLHSLSSSGLIHTFDFRLWSLIHFSQPFYVNIVACRFPGHIPYCLNCSDELLYITLYTLGTYMCILISLHFIIPMVISKNWPPWQNNTDKTNEITKWLSIKLITYSLNMLDLSHVRAGFKETVHTGFAFKHCFSVCSW